MPNRRGGAAWRCVCDCGGESIVRTCMLTSKKSRSCGCLQRERARERRVDPAATKARSLAWAANKRRTDPRWRATVTIRQRMYATLRERGVGKVAGTMFSILGYSRDDLVDRLLATMPPGCTWDDYLAGRLEIDHRLPLASFSYTSTSDPGFREAWALSNLQLMPAEENRRKGARLDWPPSTPVSPDTSGPPVVTVECHERQPNRFVPEEPQMTAETSTRGEP